jgi:hypothetical protein
MDLEAASVVPILIEALKNGNGYFRLRAASALGSIGTEAKDAVPALTEALRDRQSEVRASAASALERITQRQ